MLDAVFIINTKLFAYVFTYNLPSKQQICSPYDHAGNLMLILNVVTSNCQTSD